MYQSFYNKKKEDLGEAFFPYFFTILHLNNYWAYYSTEIVTKQDYFLPFDSITLQFPAILSFPPFSEPVHNTTFCTRILNAHDLWYVNFPAVNDIISIYE